MEIGGRNDQLMPYDAFAPKAPKGKGAQKAQERTQEAQNQIRIRFSCAFCVRFVPFVFGSHRVKI